MVPKLLSASSIDGTKVKNPVGEDIGKLKDLMVDWNSGNVVYAVMSFGGFLGMGEKLFAIPLQSFTFKDTLDDEHAVLDVEKEQLKNAPGFDKDNWPQQPDYQFIDSVHTYYGYDKYSSRYVPGV